MEPTTPRKKSDKEADAFFERMSKTDTFASATKKGKIVPTPKEEPDRRPKIQKTTITTRSSTSVRPKSQQSSTTTSTDHAPRWRRKPASTRPTSSMGRSVGSTTSRSRRSVATPQKSAISSSSNRRRSAGVPRPTSAATTRSVASTRTTATQKSVVTSSSRRTRSAVLLRPTSAATRSVASSTRSASNTTRSIASRNVKTMSTARGRRMDSTVVVASRGASTTTTMEKPVPTTRSVPNLTNRGEENKDSSHIPFTQTDVDTVVGIVNKSNEGPLAIAAIVADDYSGTTDSYDLVQWHLKAVLRKELIEATAGTIQSERKHLANLVFRMEDGGRLVLDDEGLPIFRGPGCAQDGSLTPSFAIAIKQAILTAAKFHDTQEEIDTPLSVKLHEKIIGYGKQEEVESLRSIATLSHQVVSKLNKKKQDILEAFESSADGTTEEKLLERKSKFEEEKNTLNESLLEEQAKKEALQKSINDLDQAFVSMLKGLNVDDDQSEIDFIDETTTFDVIVHAIENRYEMLAQQEKAKNEAIVTKDDFTTHRLRLESLLTSNREDRDSKQEEIVNLNNSIEQWEYALSTARTSKGEEEKKKDDAENDRVAAVNNFNELDVVLGNVGTVLLSDEPQVNELDIIRSYIPVPGEALREAAFDLRDKIRAKNKAVTNRDNAKKIMDNRAAQRDSKLASYNTSVKATATAKQQYDNTASKVKDGKWSEKTNPEKSKKKKVWQNAKEDEQKKKNDYNTAKENAKNAKSNYEEAGREKERKEQDVEDARKLKENKGKEAQSAVNLMKTNALIHRNEAEKRKSNSNTKISVYAEVIQNNIDRLKKGADDLKRNSDKHKELEDTINFLESNLEKVIRLEEQAKDHDDTLPLVPQENYHDDSELQILLQQRTAMKAGLEEFFAKEIALEKKIASLQNAINKADEDLQASPSVRTEKLKKLENIRDSAMEIAIASATSQLKTIMLTAGYDTLGTWAGNIDEEVENASTVLLRTLVADTKKLLRPVNFRTAMPSESYEQLNGSFISDVDIQNVESIVKKLSKHVVYGDPVEIEQLVQEEFEIDEDVLPSELLIVNCTGDNKSWEQQIILNPSKFRFQRLLFSCEALYKQHVPSSITNTAPHEWILLRPLSASGTTKPLEQMMESLAFFGSSDWALNSCASYLLTSWLQLKSLRLSSIEEVSGLIDRLNALYKSPEQAAKELEIFRERNIKNATPPEESKEEIDVSFIISSSVISRMLSLKDAVTDAENNIIGSSQTGIVTMTKSVKASFLQFCRELYSHAVNMINTEIMRRKTAILAGDSNDLWGSKGEEAVSLDDLIRKQEEALDAKENELRGSLEESKQYADRAKANAESWEIFKFDLDNRIEVVKEQIEEKDAELHVALRNRETNEQEILQRLKDSAQLRKELEVLKKQRQHIQQRADVIQSAAEEAYQEVLKVEGKIDALRIDEAFIEEMTQSLENKTKDLAAWKAFMESLNEELTEKSSGIQMRSALAVQYKTLTRSGNKEMFELLGVNIPHLRASTDMFATTANAEQILDLRRVLDQILLEYPKIDYQSNESTIIVSSTNSLSYTEVEAALLEWVTTRISRNGFNFDEYGNLKVMESSSFRSLTDFSIPAPILRVIMDRIQRCEHPDSINSESDVANWDTFIAEQTYETALKKLEDASYSGSINYASISKWDVLLEYVQTINVVVGKTLVIDKPVLLGGFNFYVTAGKNIQLLDENSSIDTSPSETLELFHETAKSGEEKNKFDDKSGTDGNDGLCAPAGKNAGHITLHAYGLLLCDDKKRGLFIRAAGADGADGQVGGDGEEGRKGKDTTTTDPEDISIWKDKGVSLSWGTFPGCDIFGERHPEKDDQVSKAGGDGGVPGLGGQGGSKGQVILRQENNLRGMFASTNDSFPYGNLEKVSTQLEDGSDGVDSTSFGSGGSGGEPGNRDFDKVYNKDGLFSGVEKTTTYGFISDEYEDKLDGTPSIGGFLATVALSVAFVALAPGMVLLGAAAGIATAVHVFGRHERENSIGVFEKRKIHEGKAFNDGDFKDNKVPWIPQEKMQRIIDLYRQQLSRGKIGVRRTKTRSRKERQTNLNISAEDQFQRQQYEQIQVLQNEDEFTKAGEKYAAEGLALQQQVNALQKQLTVTKETIINVQKQLESLNQKQDQLDQESTESNDALDTLNKILEQKQSELKDTEKQAMSKILSGLDQTEEIKQLSLDLSNMAIDNKYSEEMRVKLQAIVGTMKAMVLGKQLELQQEQQELQRQIASLTAELLRTNQMKGELVSVTVLSELDALLLRTQTLTNTSVSQQQRKQRNVQIEVEEDDDAIDSLEGTSVLLSLQDTFVHDSSAPGSIWPSLISQPQVKEVIDTILTALPSIPEKKRLLTVELLEVLIRYCIFHNKFEIIENMLIPPLEVSSAICDRVKETFNQVKDELSIDHWFVGSIAGVSILVSSPNRITVDEASLTCRYDQVDGMPPFGSLTKNERAAAKLVHEFETKGSDFQQLSQFLKFYTDAVINAISLNGSGYLAILQGKPVKFIDKVSRMILLSLRRDDDALADQNLELIIGMAKVMRGAIESIDILVLHNSLMRKRDIRGGGGFTRLFLENADAAQTLLDANNRTEALAKLRSTGISSENPTMYGPRDLNAVLSCIRQAEEKVHTSAKEEITNILNAVARALSNNRTIINEKVDAITLLNRLLHSARAYENDASISLDLKKAASGPIFACVTECLICLANIYSDHDEKVAAVIRTAGMTRLNVQSLSIIQSIKRVLAFFHFVEQTLQSPAASFSPVSSQESQEMTTRLLMYLESTPLPYPAYESETMLVLESLLQTNDEYEDAVEKIAYSLVIVRPEYEYDKDDGNDLLQKILTIEPPIDFLLHLALNTKSIQASAEIDIASLSAEIKPSTLNDIRQMTKDSFAMVTVKEKAENSIENLVVALVFQLPSASLCALWGYVWNEEGGPNVNDVILIIFAIVRSRPDTAYRVHNQLGGASYLWRNWPTLRITDKEYADAVTVIHETTTSIVNAVITNILSLLQTYPTTIALYLQNLFEGALKILAKELGVVPKTEFECGLHAVQLDVILALYNILRYNVNKKEEIAKTKDESERLSAQTSTDNFSVHCLCKLCTDICKSDSNDPSAFTEAIRKSVAMYSTVEEDKNVEEILGTMDSICSNLASVIQSTTTHSPATGHRLQMKLAHFLYVTIVTMSNKKHVALFDKPEALHVAKAMFQDWNGKMERNDSRASGIVILQTLVLETRTLEYNAISTKSFSAHSSAQKMLIDSAKQSLPVRTTSMEGKVEESPSLLSENRRREQLWNVCFCQLNDEFLRSEESSSSSPVWSSIATSLEARKNDFDQFETELMQQVNQAIFARRNSNVLGHIPKNLVEGSKDQWAEDNSVELGKMLDLVQYKDMTLTTFNFNVLLDEIIERLANILPLATTEGSRNETAHEMLDRSNTIGWLFNRLCDTFGGMYIAPSDDDLERKLSRTVAPLSNIVSNDGASAKLLDATERLIVALERMNPRSGRYSQIPKLMKDTYGGSELRRRLLSVDGRCILASSFIERTCTATSLLRDEENLIFEFAETLRDKKNFADSNLDEFESKLATLITHSGDEKKKATQRLLAVDVDTTSDMSLTFKEIEDLSQHVADESTYAKELVMGAYEKALEVLGGRLHHLLGMARESDFNFSARKTAIQKAVIKQDYNEAAKLKSNHAYNNMMCNAFSEAREQQMTFDVARGQVLPIFEELAKIGDKKAEENAQLLKEGKKAIQRYKLESPDASVNPRTMFSTFETTIKNLVVLLEKVINAACSSRHCMNVLGSILGQRADKLYEDICAECPNLANLTETLTQFTNETVELIKVSDPLQNSLNDCMTAFYSGERLDTVSEWHGFVMALPDLSIVSQVLFPQKGDNILYKQKVMSNKDALNFIQDVLPRIFDRRIQILEHSPGEVQSQVFQSVILRRFLTVIRKDLGAYQDNAPNNTSILERIQTMTNAALFQNDNHLEAIGNSIEIIFTAKEQRMANILTDESNVDAIYEMPSQKVRSPARWYDMFYQRVMLQLLQDCAVSDIQQYIVELRENFWSPSIPRSEQMPLQNAEDEVQKVEHAMSSILNTENVVNLNVCAMHYQNIYNALHWILYLITADYITNVRSPKPNTETKLEMESNPQFKADWESVRNTVQNESRQMVKDIKAAAERVLDIFGDLRKVHERLVAVETIFQDDATGVYTLINKLLRVQGASAKSIEYTLWLIQTDDPMASKAFVDRVFDSRDEEKTLDELITIAALDMMEADIIKLCESGMEGNKKREYMNSASVQMTSLRKQTLTSAGGVRFIRLLLTTIGRILNDTKQRSGRSSKEQIKAFLHSLQLSVEGQVWQSKPLLLQLEAYALPSRWLPKLDQYKIAIALSYNPETTNEEDKDLFLSTATSVQRFRSRRGPDVSQIFLECLQILAKANGSNVQTFATIAGKVASNQWDFSIQDKNEYEAAAMKESGGEMVEYLENMVIERQEETQLRSITDIVEIMKEEVLGANASISHFLELHDSDGGNGESMTEIEWKVQCIKNKFSTFKNANGPNPGKAIDEWEKDDVIAWSKVFKTNSSHHSYFTNDHVDKLDEMIAVFTRVTILIKEEDLRKPQLLAIIIFVDSIVRGVGLLGEIGTGEGKTVIAILCAAARVFKGDNVDVISSSRVLAERDSIEAEEWFDYFNFKVGCNCTKKAESDVSERKKVYEQSQIVYGDAGSFQRDILLTEFYDKDIRKHVADSLVVDEVDSLLIDSVANTLYISHDIQDLKLLNDVFVSIWLAVHGRDTLQYSESGVALVKKFLDIKIEEGNLLVPSWLKKFMEGRVDMWIRSAYKAKAMSEGDEYILLESGRRRGQVTVVDLYTGVEMPNTQWSNGLHQFVSLKHNNKLSAESLKAIFMANVNFVQKYGDNVVGMTGTLGTSSELGLLDNIYGVEAFRMPRFMEERYYEDESIIVGNRARWMELLTDHVVSEANNSSGFDINKTREDVTKQEKKLKKAKKELTGNEANVIKRNSRIEEVNDIMDDMATLRSQLSNSNNIQSNTLAKLDSLLQDLESSHMIKKDKDDQREELENAEKKLEKNEDDVEKRNGRIKEVNDIMDVMITLRSQFSHQNNVQSDTLARVDSLLQDLDSSHMIEKDTEDGGSARSSLIVPLSVAVEEMKTHLNNSETDFKADNVQDKLIALEQGLSEKFVQYIKKQEKKLKKDEDNVEEAKAEIEKRAIELTVLENLMKPLLDSMEEMKTHLEDVAAAENNANSLLSETSKLNTERMNLAIGAKASEMNSITEDLASANTRKNIALYNLHTLKIDSHSKGANVQGKFDALEQSLSKKFDEYISKQRKKLKKNKDNVEEALAEIEKRTIKLAASTTAVEKNKGGRAVLIICRNKNDADDVAATLAARQSIPNLYLYTGTNDNITKLDPTTGVITETNVTKERLSPHDVIVATNIAGRGTSFKTTDVIEQCGGLHVVLAYVPSNIRVEKQAWGRTSRKGKNGSGKFIVYDPRLPTSQEEINIDYLLTERDLIEEERLEKIQTETISRVRMEKILFRRFQEFSERIIDTSALNSELQRKELRDQWAFFLEELDDALDEHYKDPDSSKERLLERFSDFEKNQTENLKKEFGLIESPGNLLHVVSTALRNEDYNQAKKAAQSIIDNDENFAGYGYYYHALALFGSGTNNTDTKKKAIKELEKAIVLLKKQSDRLQSQCQVVNSVNGTMQKQGIGINSDFFSKNNANTISLIHVHIAAAERVCGRPMSEADFKTSAISGDVPKQVFDIVKDDENLRNFITPLCVSDKVKVRLCVVTSERTEVNFLTEPRDENSMAWIADNVLEVSGVTNNEMAQVKNSAFPWKLVLYVNDDQQVDTNENQRQVRFPSSLDYAVPEILEKLQQLVQDKKGGDFKLVDKKVRANLKDYFFNFLLSQDEINGAVSAITDGDKQDYIVLDDNYISKSFGRWDDAGFCDVGDEIKQWLLGMASPGKKIAKSEISSEVTVLLREKGRQESDATVVVEAITTKGLGTVVALQPVKAEKFAIISDDSDLIVMKADISDELIQNLPLEDFDFLRKFGDKLRGKLIKSKGKDLRINDFEEIFTGKEFDDFIRSHSFLLIQTLTRTCGISKRLCDRLGIATNLAAGPKKDALDNILSEIGNTVDMKKIGDVASSASAELQGTLINQGVLEIPRVDIGIDGKEELKKLTENIEKHLKIKIEEIAESVKIEDETKEEKTKAMMDDIVAAVTASVTELAKMGDKVKVDFKTLGDLLVKDGGPPELLDFMAAAVNIVFQVVEKREVTWDWGAFAVGMIGLAQVVAGAAILVLSGGTATNIGGALIGEGIGDIMFATVAGLTGTFSWEEYGKQKAISLAVTASVGIISAGVGTLAARGAQVAAMTATKVATAVMVKAVAKQVLKEMLIATTVTAAGMLVTEVQDTVTEGLFKVLRTVFGDFLGTTKFNEETVTKIKETLGTLMDQFGEKKATNYLNDALSDSSMNEVFSENANTWIDGATAVVANLEGEMNGVAERAKYSDYSGNKYERFAQAAKYIANTAIVVTAITKMVRHVPQVYDKIDVRLRGIQPDSDSSPPDDILTGNKKDTWRDKQMQEISDAIYKKLESLFSAGIVGTALADTVTNGTNKIFSSLGVDSLGADLDALQKRALAVDAIEGFNAKEGKLTTEERENLVKIQKQLVDEANQYPSILSDVDPESDPDLVVRYNGENVKLKDITDMMGKSGLKVYETRSGGEKILMRPPYEDYIKGLDIERPANLMDIHAMAKAAKMDITLYYDKDGISHTENIVAKKPDDGSPQVDAVNIVLKKGEDYPQGRYVLEDDNGNILYKDEFKNIGAASAAQLLVYKEARANNLDHDAAMKEANSEEKIEAFLQKTRETALNVDNKKSEEDEDTIRDLYEKAEYEEKNTVLGGSSPHPLPLIPNPRKINYLKFGTKSKYLSMKRKRKSEQKWEIKVNDESYVEKKEDPQPEYIVKVNGNILSRSMPESNHSAKITVSDSDAHKVGNVRLTTKTKQNKLSIPVRSEHLSQPTKAVNKPKPKSKLTVPKQSPHLSLPAKQQARPQLDFETAEEINRITKEAGIPENALGFEIPKISPKIDDNTPKGGTDDNGGEDGGSNDGNAPKGGTDDNGGEDGDSNDGNAPKGDTDNDENTPDGGDTDNSGGTNKATQDEDDSSGLVAVIDTPKYESNNKKYQNDLIRWADEEIGDWDSNTNYAVVLRELKLSEPLRTYGWWTAQPLIKVVMENIPKLLKEPDAKKPLHEIPIPETVPTLPTSFIQGELVKGTKYYSPNGEVYLEFNGLGNLIVKGPNGVLWTSATVGGDRCCMEDDGNLVISRGGTTIWASYTSGNDGAFVSIRNHDCVVICKNDRSTILKMYPSTIMLNPGG